MNGFPLRWRGATVAALLVLGLGSPSSRAEGEVRAVARVGFPVRDLERSVAFFTSTLGFERTIGAGAAASEASTDRPALARVERLRLGDEILELVDYEAAPGDDVPADLRSDDLAFQHVAIVVADMARAYEVLQRAGVREISPGPQRLPDWNPDAGGIEAFYFRDPDGHFLEILHFPPGKGDPNWQRRDRPFLGIDHTAIVSTDTERSLRFYRDGLGMKPAGGAENHGAEQEHLNNVFGVRLRITTLRAKDGPGIELLEYLAPRTGRPAPLDLSAADLAHWHTTVVAQGASRLLRTVFGGWLVSPDVVAADPRWGFARGLLVRDPDAHGIRVVER